MNSSPVRLGILTALLATFTGSVTAQDLYGVLSVGDAAGSPGGQARAREVHPRDPWMAVSDLVVLLARLQDPIAPGDDLAADREAYLAGIRDLDRRLNGVTATAAVTPDEYLSVAILVGWRNALVMVSWDQVLPDGSCLLEGSCMPRSGPGMGLLLAGTPRRRLQILPLESGQQLGIYRQLREGLERNLLPTIELDLATLYHQKKSLVARGMTFRDTLGPSRHWPRAFQLAIDARPFFYGRPEDAPSLLALLAHTDAALAIRNAVPEASSDHQLWPLRQAAALLETSLGGSIGYWGGPDFDRGALRFWTPNRGTLLSDADRKFKPPFSRSAFLIRGSSDLAGREYTEAGALLRVR
jgi:hypothetical protein